MNKAFVKENDGDEQGDDDIQAPLIPVGAKNYMTPNGAKRLQEELYHLKFKERPEVTKIVSWAAENGDRSENGDYIYGKKKLREIDRRIRFLAKRLDNVEVIDPLKISSEQVLFGATVVVRNEDGTERCYRIVGVDETDIEAGKISWISPLGSALLKAHEGDFVSFRSPKGIREIEILSVRYLAIE